MFHSSFMKELLTLFTLSFNQRKSLLQHILPKQSLVNNSKLNLLSLSPLFLNLRIYQYPTILTILSLKVTKATLFNPILITLSFKQTKTHMEINFNILPIILEVEAEDMEEEK